MMPAEKRVSRRRAQMLMDELIDRLCKVMSADTALALIDDLFQHDRRWDTMMTLTRPQLLYARDVFAWLHDETGRTMH